MPVFAGLGALNVDRIYRVKQLLPDGEAAIESAGIFPGGSAANTIFGLARLGVSTGFCGMVGNDAGGEILLADFKKAGTDTSQIHIDNTTETGSVLCISSDAARSLFVIQGANSKLTPDAINISYLGSCEWLHVSSFVGDQQFQLSHEIIASLPEAVKLSFSPGTLYVKRGFSALLPFFKRTSVLFINRSEIENLTGLNFENGAKRCLEAGCKSVTVTLGAGLSRDGEKYVAYVATNTGGKFWITAGHPKQIEIADTTGAGDAFAAGYLFGVLSGKEPGVCGQYGHTAASLSIRKCGARQGLPSGDELLQEHRSLYS